MEGFYVFECNNNVCESYISENNPPATKRPTEETLGTEITDAAQQRDIFLVCKFSKRYWRFYAISLLGISNWLSIQIMRKLQFWLCSSQNGTRKTALLVNHLKPINQHLLFSTINYWSDTEKMCKLKIKEFWFLDTLNKNVCKWETV